MVESDLLANLAKEQDWNMAAVFTEKETVLAQQKCTLLPDEVK